MTETTATFEIGLTPGASLVEGSGRFDFSKTWTGGLAGASTGTMLSGGDPKTGTAGYVALERFEGVLDGRAGGFMLQQYGTMSGAISELRYEVVPGSGSGALAGLTGSVALKIEAGVHRVTFRYTI